MTNAKNVSCVLFDLDGTIIDSSPGILRCFKLGLASVGVSDVPDDEYLLGRIIGPPLAYSYTKFIGLSDEESDMAIAAYRADYRVKGYAESTVYSGMTECLSALREAGIPIGMATSKPEEMALSIVKDKNIYHLFDVICGAKPSDKHSSKPQLITRALDSLGITADKRVFMVGDKSYDIEGAAAVGISSLGVTYGFGTLSELTRSGADFTADSPEDIANFFLT